MSNTTHTAIPANSIAKESFLDDAFAAIHARLLLLSAVNLERIDPDVYSEALTAFVDEISDALRYHQAQRTPWSHAEGEGGSDE